MMMDSNEKPIWVSAEEAMFLLGVARQCLYAQINSGRLKSTKFGGRRLISLESIEMLAETPAPRRRPVKRQLVSPKSITARL